MSEKCDICFRGCTLEEGRNGYCKVRTIKDGKNVSRSYGLISSAALDPIEKSRSHCLNLEAISFQSDPMAAIYPVPSVRTMRFLKTTCTLPVKESALRNWSARPCV